MVEIIKPGTKFNFLGKRKQYYVISAVLITLSLGAMGVRTVTNGTPFNYGIDFTGGTEIQLAFKGEVRADEVRAAMSSLGFDAEVQSVETGGENTNYLARIRQQVTVVNKDLATRVESGLKAKQEQLGTLVKFEPTTSGDRIYLRFDKQPDQTALRAVFTELNLEIQGIEQTGRPQDFTFQVNVEELQNRIATHMGATFAERFVEVARVQVVGPKAGEQLRNDGILAAVVALLLIVLYVAIRYDFRFSVGALVSLFHDPLITMGCFAIFWWDFSLSAVAALLTILGYSINDTIVIFDRIREVLRAHKDGDLVKISNQALNETLSRTILTSTATMLSVLALLILGGSLLREFMLALAIGLVIGVYSTIGVASAIMIDMDRILPKLVAFFGPEKKAARGTKAAAAAASKAD